MLELSKVREMGFYKDGLSRDRIKMVSVCSVCCQGIWTANRGNIPAAISDTGVLSATLGMPDMMIRMILAHCTDGNIPAGVDVIFYTSGKGKVCVCMCVCVCVCVCEPERERLMGKVSS